MAKKKRPAKKPARKKAPKHPAAKKPAPPVVPPPRVPRVAAPAPGDGERDRKAAVSRKRHDTSREAGFPPNIADPDRREACSRSLKLFCETYSPQAFAMGWSESHLRAIARMEEAATRGALFAFAMPRGSGKTTISRMAALWATLNAVCRYAFVIGATSDKAGQSLDAMKTLIRFSDTLADDYPEVSHYARALNGIANRATGQTCDGVSTMIEWSADGIVFPTVPPPENWPEHWPRRGDGMVPTSGIVIATSGLTGDGLRGSVKQLTNGENVRPDFVLLDDPQTPESARSKTQNVVREQLVSADVLGMAGPGKKIAAVMPCTVIEPGDMADQLLNRKKHPLWRGERSGILKSLPKNLDKWDEYLEEYARCAQLEPPDFTDSNALYRRMQTVLEEGAVASWEARKDPGDVSAIQHAMHIRFRDPFAFAAEYMNDPKPLHAVAASVLNGDALAKKVTNLARLVVPRPCTRVTAFIDVGAHLLWYAVVAWDERFGGSVIDYGAYPDQNRIYFAAGDARHTLGTVPGMERVPQEAAIYAGLAALTARILDRKYVQEETGTELHARQCLIDANWGPFTDLVYDFCRRDGHAGVLLPSHGKYIGPKATPINGWAKRSPDEVKGPGWRISTAETGKRGRKVVFDTNHFKTFLAERFRTPLGAPGCLTLFNAPEGGHQMFADHCTAEYPKPREEGAAGYAVDEWVSRMNRDNHLWDCVVGNALAASLTGLRWDAGAASGVKRSDLVSSAPALSFSEEQRLARAARGYNGGRR
ncbi:Uncharacterized protein OS=Isosphaera pallida (strain ATCC 43644 / DSM 9630 / IS1B) GN=Isop_2452 PE=4 SV=1: Terminase_GpA [Gemmata massiliana]|uniref:Terminase large subunit GpA endonuclease domain-containing protein n=1 Tax=Gemmata massiliana TaxID=1210884 RepID=A0A6P2CYD0_9BACT|nr:terminase gpA endonuclease subunit [Gemmata massiliana]VTR92804.1 Uncharacterized protein OS=Isosphaera pallida (strain ATCC 43644 / DSM 9630 / IS1B) GN=Isop_2452 PE=4 SV=1: Terminase_GpA [Gemmata massiliana]